VEAGDKFSACLTRYPSIFPNVFANMIKAAELGGMMDEVLKKLAVFLEKEQGKFPLQSYPNMLELKSSVWP